MCAAGGGSEVMCLYVEWGARARAYARTHAFALTHAHTHTRIHACTCTCTSTCTCSCTHTLYAGLEKTQRIMPGDKYNSYHVIRLYTIHIYVSVHTHMGCHDGMPRWYAMVCYGMLWYAGLQKTRATCRETSTIHIM